MTASFGSPVGEAPVSLKEVRGSGRNRNSDESRLPEGRPQGTELFLPELDGSESVTGIIRQTCSHFVKRKNLRSRRDYLPASSRGARRIRRSRRRSDRPRPIPSA